MALVSELVRLSHHGGIAVVTIDNPPVNALSSGVPEAILAAVREAAADASVQAIVVRGAGTTFIAGADIREFGKMASGELPSINLADIILGIEDSPKPVVMALHGTTFGGGLEVAMGGHYRVIAPSGQVGQPEVKIGLIPGAAGTQRLPRLAGIPKALEMCALGEPVGASEALQHGITDRIIEGDLLEGAVAFAREIASKPFRKTRERNEKLWKVGAAGNAAMTAVLASVGATFEAGVAQERELFDQCLRSTESKALIHAFFGERTVAKIPDIPKDTRTFTIQRAAVIGAGTMGGGIAMAFANAGIPVLMKETSQEALDRGMATIRGNYAASVMKGRFPQETMDRRLALITPQLGYNGFEEADVIVEAVFENMALKKSVFAELDGIAKPSCILATNTSTLDIDEIASVTKRPEMVLGLHFFSPANVMRLLEVVRGAATNKESIATAIGLGKRLKKVAVLAGNCEGFIGNRMVHLYLREAQFLLEEGASVAEIDGALVDFGMAMGPLAVCDLAGIDVGWRIRQEARHREKPGVRQPLVADRLYELGRYGQKTRRGFWLYDANRRPSPDPEVAEIARQVGVEQRPIGRDEIVERCVYALINEGARILEEGIALRAVDIDIVYLNGYGFPARRGGPMFYADTIGIDRVLARIEEFNRQHGPELWSPAPMLRRLAESGGKFHA
jgi:3-hydroxyacyl-CoA dehydrogenase